MKYAEDDKIGDSEYTVRWLLDVVKANHLCDANTADDIALLEVEDIAGGKGMTASVFKTTIRTKSGQECCLALKVPNFQRAEDDFAIMDIEDEEYKKIMEDREADKRVLCGFFNLEINAYEFFRKENIPLPRPQVYSMEKIEESSVRGILAMQYCKMSAPGVLTKSLSLNQLLSIARRYAVFHYVCIQSDCKKYFVNANEFMIKLSETGPAVFTPIAKQITEIDHGRFDVLFAKLEPYFRDVSNWKTLYGDFYVKLGLPTVVVHGDFTNMNIMWNKDNAELLDCFFDFGQAHSGCCTEDFAHLFISSVDPKIRREHGTEVLKQYYADLDTQFRAHGQVINFTFEKLLESYNICFPVLLLRLLFLVVVKIQKNNLTSEEKEGLLNRAEAAMVDSIKILGL